MRRKHTLSLLLLPFLCIAQTEISYLPYSSEIIKTKWNALRGSGRLDSAKAEVFFFKDYQSGIKSRKQFYAYIDTVRYDDNSYAVGKMIIDTLMEFDRRKIDEWKFYYPSGKVYSKGNFSIGAYTECEFAGYSVIGYSFKTGEWNYFYESGSLLAKGNYEPSQLQKKTNCGMDTINISNVTPKWIFYDNSGNKLNDIDAILSKINNEL